MNNPIVLTQIPIVVKPVTFPLLVGDDVPNARQPMCHQREGQHQQGQDHRTVLGVPVDLLQEARQPEQPGQLDEVYVVVAEGVYGFLKTTGEMYE